MHTFVVLVGMLKEFEGTIGMAGLCEFGERTWDYVSAGPKLRFRAVLDSTIADTILLAISFGEQQQALRMLLESSVSLERQAASFEPLKRAQTGSRSRSSHLRVVK